MRAFVLCVVLWCGCVANNIAQKDSTATFKIDSGNVVIESNQAIELIAQTSRLSPKEAGKRSAVLPGWGQAYNKKYWKIPIVYALAGAVGYGIYWNNQQFQLFKDAYEGAVLTGNPQNLNLDRLRFLRNEYRRQKEQLIILAIGVYGLNVVDAIVDAHLSSFDINDDLSLRFKPQFEMLGFQQQTLAGFGLVLNF